MKTCSMCGIDKPLTEYHRRAASPDGYNKRCKLCRADAERMTRYSISLDELRQLEKDADGCCQICGVHESEAGGRGGLHVDHCHETGRVRGLLCHHCNTALGKFQDSEDILLNAIQYLRR